MAKIIGSGVASAEALATRDAGLGFGEVGREASMLDDDVWRLVDNELTRVLREQAKFPELLDRYGITKELGNYGQKRMDVWDEDDVLVATQELGLGPIKANQVSRSRNTTPYMSTYCDVQADPLDLEASRHGLADPIDALGIRQAIEVVTTKRNEFLAAGSTDEGVDGLLNKTNRTSFTGNDWGTAGNGLKDIRGMTRRLQVDDVPEEVPRVLFVHPTNEEELKEEKTNTLGSQIKLALESEVAEIVATKRRTVGTATMVALSASWVKHVVTKPVTVSEMGSLGMAPVFRVWCREAIWNSKAKTVVDATSI
jgi:uncharacterized linocin/CFP29 family protein